MQQRSAAAMVHTIRVKSMGGAPFDSSPQIESVWATNSLLHPKEKPGGSQQADDPEQSDTTKQARQIFLFSTSSTSRTPHQSTSSSLLFSRPRHHACYRTANVRPTKSRQFPAMKKISTTALDSAGRLNMDAAPPSGVPVGPDIERWIAELRCKRESQR